MPRGSVFVSCAAPFGSGGLGAHLKEIVETLDRLGQPRRYVCADDRVKDPGRRALLSRTTLMAPVARFHPGWRIWKQRVEFDAYAAARMTPAEHLIAFNRQALAQFQAARTMGYRSVGLMTGSPHVRRVARQHARAYERYPLERSFGTHIVKRYLDEYEQADRIYVASRYTWDSFLEHGVPEDKLALFPLTPAPPLHARPRAARGEHVQRCLRRQPQRGQGRAAADRRDPPSSPTRTCRLTLDRRLENARHAPLHRGGTCARSTDRGLRRAIRCRTFAAPACACTRPTRTGSPTRRPRRWPAACR